jgi:hypothetical protein
VFSIVGILTGLHKRYVDEFGEIEGNILDDMGVEFPKEVDDHVKECVQICIHEFPFIHHHVELCVVCSHSLPWVYKINSMIIFYSKVVFCGVWWNPSYDRNSSLYVLALIFSYFQLQPSHLLFCTQRVNHM